MYESTRVLVTGGAGFLGRNLVDALLPSAAQIIVLDDLFTGQEHAIPQSSRVRFVHGSVADAMLVRGLLADVEYVFHFAARNIALSVEQPESDFRVNVEGSLELLLGAMACPGIRRIVFASSASVYGNSGPLPLDEGRYDISLPYAASKLSAELLATSFHKTYGVPVTIVRFSNVYGPGQVASNPYCGVVAKFMESIEGGEPMTVLGDGTQTRDFTYVEDAIRATLLAGLGSATLGGVFNVGTGVETEIGALAALVARTAGRPQHPVVHAPERAIDTVRRRAVDASRLHRAVGWTPRVAIAEGLALTWDWFRQSGEGGQHG